MDMMAVFLKGLGISPEVFAQTQQLFVDIGETVGRMQQQLDRIELNTIAILQSGSAAPTRYDIMPVLDALPPMTHEDERKAA